MVLRAGGFNQSFWVSSRPLENPAHICHPEQSEGYAVLRNSGKIACLMAFIGIATVLTGGDARPPLTTYFRDSPLQRAFQRLIQRSFCCLIFLLRNPPLFVLHFELKDLFLQRFE